MRFVLGKIPDNTDFDPQSAGWTAIKEPNPWVAQLIALPLGLLGTGLLALVWFFSTPLGNLDLDWNWTVFLWIIGLIVVHELIHAL